MIGNASSGLYVNLNKPMLIFLINIVGLAPVLKLLMTLVNCRT